MDGFTAAALAMAAVALAITIQLRKQFNETVDRLSREISELKAAK